MQPGDAIYPDRKYLNGKGVSIVPLSPAHAPALWKHLGGAQNTWRWTYMLSTGFEDPKACEDAITTMSSLEDPQFYAVLIYKSSTKIGETDHAKSGEAAGLISFLSVVPTHRRIEIGSVILGDAVRASKAGTEAFYLFIKRAFDLGYLRVEWKANALNEKSLKTARRLGFTFEGIFR